MNGVPKSPLNRYNQVTDAVVAHNTWIDCASPWQLSVGANVSQSDVLPPSEIRSARPLRTIVANNIIYNHKQDAMPVQAYDKVDGVLFSNNVIDNQGETVLPYEGIVSAKLAMEQKADWLFVPSAGQDDLLGDVYAGFEFDKIRTDIFGSNRSNGNIIGAITSTNVDAKNVLNKSLYGSDWFTKKAAPKGVDIMVSSAEGELSTKLAEANEGDVIVLTDENYQVVRSLVINKAITIRSKEATKKATITYSGAARSPVFLMNPKGDLCLANVVVNGNVDQYAIATKKENMAGPYYLDIEGAVFKNFKYVLKAYKSSFADSITFKGVDFADCDNGIELAAEIDDKGDYNVEVLTITDCSFTNIKSNVINFYRGGYDESTIGGILKLTNNTFTQCGASEVSNILVKTRGIVNVDIFNNTFKNNPVKVIALLWGEKNNNHGDNIVVNSGEIVVEANIKLKLLY